MSSLDGGLDQTRLSRPSRPFRHQQCAPTSARLLHQPSDRSQLGVSLQQPHCVTHFESLPLCHIKRLCDLAN
jgi:hypothetical protein